MMMTYATARVITRRVREGEQEGRAAEGRSDLRAVRFSLGKLYVTPGALTLLAETREDGRPYSVHIAARSEDPLTLVLPFVQRHASGDWGDVCAEDWNANDEALTLGARLFSAYELETHGRLWIITEADRSATTVLLPAEY
jgi:hypothetical protein